MNISTPSLPHISQPGRASSINFNRSYLLLRWKGKGTDSKFLAWAETQPLDAGKDSNRAVSLKRLGCYSPPKPLIFLASASSFTQHRHYLTNLKKKKIPKNLVWNVAVQHYRQMLLQPLYFSTEIASHSANFRAINTNIYTSYQCSFPLYGHHSPNTFHPWFSLSHKCMRRKHNCGQNVCTTF